MHDHARVDATGLPAEPGEGDAEERQHGQAEDEAVAEPEREARDQDRRERRDELGQQPVPEATVEKLLDERRHDRDDEGIRDERRGLAGVPRFRNEALLVSGVEELAQDGRHDDDRGERCDGQPDSPPGAFGHPQPEQLPPEPMRDRDDQDEHEPVLDQRPDRGRPTVERVLDLLAVEQVPPGIRRAREREDEDYPGD